MTASPSPPAPRPLTEGERGLLGSALASAAVGRRDLFRAALASPQLSGLPPAALREALRMLVPYAGYPRALAAFAAAGLAPAEASSEAPEIPAEERAARGRAAFDAVYGPTAARVLDGLAALDPCLPSWTLEHAYGRVLARPGLALLERELLAVALLAALGDLDDPLLGHMRGALRLGASLADVAQMVEALPGALGEERRARGRALLARLTGGPVESP